jgi:hypothetical protein
MRSTIAIAATLSKMAFRTALVVLSALSAALAMSAAPELDAELDNAVETANITER